MKWLSRLLGVEDAAKSGVMPVMSLRMPKAVAADVAEGFAYTAEWACGCGAKLKIRARQDRDSGPSNFKAYPPRHRWAGHSVVPNAELTWNGLAEERGWQTEPKVVCPACLAGAVSTDEYRAARRKGMTVDEYRAWVESESENG